MHLKWGIPSRDMLVSSIRHSQTDNNSCERLFGIFQRITEIILNELLILTHSDNFSWLGHPHVAIVQTRDNLQWDLFDQVTWKSCWKSSWLAAAAVVHFVYAGQCYKSERLMSIDVIGQPAWPDVVLIRSGWFLGVGPKDCNITLNQLFRSKSSFLLKTMIMTKM